MVTHRPCVIITIDQDGKARNILKDTTVHVFLSGDTTGSYAEFGLGGWISRWRVYVVVSVGRSWTLMES